MSGPGCTIYCHILHSVRFVATIQPKMTLFVPYSNAQGCLWLPAASQYWPWSALQAAFELSQQDTCIVDVMCQRSSWSQLVRCFVPGLGFCLCLRDAATDLRPCTRPIFSLFCRYTHLTTLLQTYKFFPWAPWHGLDGQL